MLTHSRDFETGLVDGDMCGRINAMADYIAQQDQHHEPELGAVVIAFRFHRHHSATGIVAGRGAMLVRKIGRQAIEI